MLLTALRLTGLFLSLTGYILCLHKKGLEIAFAPVLTVSAIGTAMFFAGLFNVMPLAVWLLFAGGLVCLWLCRGSLLPDRRSKAIWLYYAGFYLVLAILLRDALPSGWDNYNHWITVVKDMLVNDQLPNRNSDLIMFQAYPTGSAGFIYFVCKIAGFRDSIMIFGHGLLLISGVTSLWAFVEKAKPLAICLCLGASAYLFFAISPVANLLVDSLVCILAVASFSLLIYYQDAPRKAAVLNSLVCSYLILVKNSGLFFILAHWLLLLALDLYRNRGRKPRETCLTWAKLSLPAAAVPLLVFFLWQRHVDYAFVDGTFTPHGMSIENYSYVLQSRNPGVIFRILYEFRNKLFHPGSEILILGALCAVYLVCLLLKKGSRKTEAACLLGSILLYGTYLVGLLLMYILSMPEWEAINIPSYSRYLTLITTYLSGLCAVYLLNRLQEPGELPRGYFLLGPVLFAVLFGIFLMDPPDLHKPGQDARTARQQIIDIRSSYDVPDGARYLVVCQWKSGIIDLLQYEFWSPDLVITDEHSTPEPEVPRLADYPDFWDRFDYLIIYQDIPGTDEFLAELGLPAGEQIYDLAQYRNGSS